MWTMERIDRLIELWNGGHTATEIALEPEFTGLTRNAVIGKLWRLRKRQPERFRPDRLPAPRPLRELKKRIVRKARMAAAMKKPPLVDLAPPRQANGGVPLFEIDPHGCRFIISSQAGRVPTHLYCGVIVSGLGAGDPPLNCYCGFHQVVMGRSVD